MNIGDHFDNPKELRPGVYEVHCPVHDDSNPSLVVWTDGDEPRVHCRAGCDWREIKDSLGWETRGHTSAPPTGCTVEEYADARRLPVDELRRWGLGNC